MLPGGQQDLEEVRFKIGSDSPNQIYISNPYDLHNINQFKIASFNLDFGSKPSDMTGCIKIRNTTYNMC